MTGLKYGQFIVWNGSEDELLSGMVQGSLRIICRTMSKMEHALKAGGYAVECSHPFPPKIQRRYIGHRVRVIGDWEKYPFNKTPPLKNEFGIRSAYN